MKNKADIAVAGLAVMGENLVLNMESKGFAVAVYNRTGSRTDDFMDGRGKGRNIIPAHSVAELCASLKRPRRIMLMVKAGAPVDALIGQLVPELENGDIIIDGGNSFFKDTMRRTKELESKGILYVGAGVSGGEEGALHGPSIMPGGDKRAWVHIEKIFRAISAKAPDGSPCCDWVGPDGSGHFVKMLHNGIEYSDMQMISEAWFLLRHLCGFNAEELAGLFTEWNKSELDSYLIEITADILRKKDPETGKYVLDMILDRAGQKGTGKWTAECALDLGIPAMTIAEAVFARCLSALKEERVEAAKILKGPAVPKAQDKRGFAEAVRQALYASKICSYAQGFQLMRAASREYGWDLNYGDIALMWRGGCIIRAKFLDDIKRAFTANRDLANLMFDPFFADALAKAQEPLRKVVASAALSGIAVPAFSSALAYYDATRTEVLPANMIQAMRDYFGAHTYERIDKPRGEYFHTVWTGSGGSATSTTYNV